MLIKVHRLIYFLVDFGLLFYYVVRQVMHIVRILGPVVFKDLLVSLHAILKLRKWVIKLLHVP